MEYYTKNNIKLFILSLILAILLSLAFYLPLNENIGHIGSDEDLNATTSQIKPLERTLVVASWYDYSLDRKDQKCLSDDCYSMFNSTCASRDYPRGTILTVRYKNKEVKCMVNDYGPADLSREIDLSSFAFSQLAPLKLGLINVEIYE